MSTYLMTIPNHITELSYLGLLKISGSDAKRFLQGQLTCHLDEVSEHQMRLGAHCNPQGRIISFFQLFLYEDSYYLQMPADLLTLARMALQKYAVFFKVTLEDASATVVRIGYSGPTADQQLKKIVAHVPNDINEACLNDNTLIIKWPGTLPRYEIIGLATTIANLMPTLTEQAHPVPRDHWRHQNILAGIPEITAKTSSQFLPHEINLPRLNAVSFNKGCYTGQEIIARMQYRGKLKKHVVRASVTCDRPPQNGSDIYIEQHNQFDIGGTLIDCCLEHHNTYQLLVLADDIDISTKSFFLDKTQKYPLAFLSLPTEI